MCLLKLWTTRRRRATRVQGRILNPIKKAFWILISAGSPKKKGWSWTASTGEIYPRHRVAHCRWAGRLSSIRGLQDRFKLEWASTRIKEWLPPWWLVAIARITTAAPKARWLTPMRSIARESGATVSPRKDNWQSTKRWQKNYRVRFCNKILSTEIQIMIWFRLFLTVRPPWNLWCQIQPQACTRSPNFPRARTKTNQSKPLTLKLRKTSVTWATETTPEKGTKPNTCTFQTNNEASWKIINSSRQSPKTSSRARWECSRRDLWTGSSTPAAPRSQDCRGRATCYFKKTRIGSLAWT